MVKFAFFLEKVQKPKEILHRRRRYVEEDDVVGFSHDTEALVKQFIEGSLRRNVVSIIGMGGLAELKEELLQGLEAKYSSNKDKLKGTLIEDLKGIKEMNDDEFKKALFEFLENIQDQSLKILLLDFVEEIYKRNGEGWEDMNDDEFESVLFKCLKDKRYFLIMDDIWKAELWNEVSTDDLNRSKILITSRIKEVALHFSSVPYELPFLKEDKSWELFIRRCSGEVHVLWNLKL
nr:putative late blight resistance protein like r1b-12 [Quercus suber]